MLILKYGSDIIINNWNDFIEATENSFQNCTIIMVGKVVSALIKKYST